jgi:hypothetical protein
MAQNYAVANVSIKDENGSQLKLGDYKAILLTFTSPGLRQIGVTSSLGSFSGNYENQIFQIVFPNQSSAEIWGSPQGANTKWKIVSKVDGNPLTITIKDATGSNSVEEIQVLPQVGTNWDLVNLGNNPSQIVISITFAGPIPGPIPGPIKYDEHGTKMLYNTTGNKVTMNVGSYKNEGQRYNCDHKFKNYMMIGYFYTGERIEQIEMKTDGPCHGCNDHPAPVPIGMWYEPKIYEDGKIELAAEWPHNAKDFGEERDHPDLRTDSTEKVEGGIKKQWIGYAVVAYTNGQNQRVIEQWASKNPFGNDEKPTNTWRRNLLAIEKGDGTMFAKKWRDIDITFPRDLDKVLNYEHGNGLESEIRMIKVIEHGKEGGTDMKWCYVYEIIPPSS